MNEKFDASLLQFIPKGSYYNEVSDQLTAVEKTWDRLFAYDREIFSMILTLPGTAYSKGRMIHKLLGNPQTKSYLEAMGSPRVEEDIALYAIQHETMPRALKMLLMLSSKELGRRNNTRTRRLIIRYIMDRPLDSMDKMLVKFRKKIARLLIHAVGKPSLNRIIGGDWVLFYNLIGQYGLKDTNYSEMIPFLFNNSYFNGSIEGMNFPLVRVYTALRQLAQSKDPAFLEYAKKSRLPYEVILGFRNTYKLDVFLKDILESGTKSKKQRIQMQSAAEREGAEVAVDYDSADILDLWKMLYHKITTDDSKDGVEVIRAIGKKADEKINIDLGKVVVLVDASHSMRGSDQRSMHPFLVASALSCQFPKSVMTVFCGGERSPSEFYKKMVYPSGPTELWGGLISAVKLAPETIVVISDGYENVVRGAFSAVYKRLREIGFTFKLIHINPVYAAEVSSSRRLVDDVQPMMISTPQDLVTAVMFALINSDPIKAKLMLTERYMSLAFPLKEAIKEIAHGSK